jgi:glycolate oxidase FAD binding subunit
MMLHQEMARLAKDLVGDPVDGAPSADFTVSPESGEDAAAVLRFAAEHSLHVLFWGGGTHQGIGYRVEPDVIMTTRRLDQIVEWQEEDLTIVVQPGVLVSSLEAQLAERGQTAVLPEVAPGATIGGVVASGHSGWRRLRYGPTRDRMLEVRLATGDGRLVRGGGRLVKNVTGYDLPRLATGSFGSLGLLSEVCLKLWPLPPEKAMVRVDDPERALALAYRPLALIETDDLANLYLAGAREEITAQADLVGGDVIDGHDWPAPLTSPVELALRVPPSAVALWVGILRQAGVAFQAAHGVGEIRFDGDSISMGELWRFREQAEFTGGALVVVRAPASFDLDPWGTPPGSAELQRRVKAAFDPIGIANPGILPGGI